MKRTTVLLILTLSAMLMSSMTSCKEKIKIRSLTEMINDEKKWIQQFIEQKQFVITDGVEEQQEFDSNTYYHFQNGLYMQVIDRGEGHAIPEKTKVSIRMKGYFFNPNPNHAFNNLSKGGYQNTEILYVDRYNRGAVHHVLLGKSLGYSLDQIMCEGIAYPLTMLGDGAKVRLIVPFQVGCDLAYKGGMPAFVEEVRYEFIKQDQ